MQLSPDWPARASRFLTHSHHLPSHLTLAEHREVKWSGFCAMNSGSGALKITKTPGVPVLQQKQLSRSVEGRSLTTGAQQDHCTSHQSPGSCYSCAQLPHTSSPATPHSHAGDLEASPDLVNLSPLGGAAKYGQIVAA